jgi:hypothetical protein
MDRRSFISKAAISTAAVLTFPAIVDASYPIDKEKDKIKKV